jgi:hypothetical protein
MGLDRGTLARLDRKLLAGLGQDETYRMVRVPVTASKWATWKRYCDTAGISMGRAIVTLIDRELVSTFGDLTDDHPPVLADQAEVELARRQEQVALREEKAAGVEQRVEFVAKVSAQPRKSTAKVGRNEGCPCGSGLKYKHCHSRSGQP